MVWDGWLGTDNSRWLVEVRVNMGNFRLVHMKYMGNRVRGIMLKSVRSSQCSCNSRFYGFSTY